MSDNIIRPEMPNCNREAVKMLENLLVEFKAGRMTSLGVVTISALGQQGFGASGLQGESVYIGLDILKQQLLMAMSKPQNIVRAAG